MRLKICIFCLLSLCVMMLSARMSSAQSINSSTISYQGLLSNASGAPADSGTYSVTVSFYSDESGQQPVWQDTFETMVRKGIFNIALGSGKTLPAPSDLDRPIWVGTRIGAMAESRPLTRLSSVPMAMNVADSSITPSKLNADYISSISVNGQKVTGKASSLNIVGNITYDDASKSLMLNAGVTITDSSGKGANAETHNGTSDYWGETGNNSTTPGTNYVGTSDSVALEIHINNSGFLNNGNGRVVRYEPQQESPNIIAGWNGNSVSGLNAIGETISGGGKQGNPNQIVNSDLNTIGGGDGNYIKARIATIAGGENGKVYSDAATIGGGVDNVAGTLLDSDYQHQTVGGGNGNIATGDDATIAGGEINTASGFHSGIGAGYTNSAISHITYIGGGDYNMASGDSSAILGGAQNTASGQSSAILGGFNNYATGKFSSILGGRRLELGDSSVGYSATNSPSVVDLAAFQNVAYFGDVDLWIGNVDDSARAIRFYAPNHNYLYTTGSYYNSFRSDTQSVNIEYILPGVSPIAGQFLKASTVSGSSVKLAWDTVTGGGGGLAGWLLNGNAGTTPGTNYLGTNDNAAFEIHVDNSDADTTGGNKRVMRYEEGATSPNIIGGSSFNSIDPSESGVAILSGGTKLNPNKINTSDTFSIVAGGSANVIDTFAPYSAILSGQGNHITGDTTLPGFGWHNGFDVISGGRGNFMGADYFRSGFNVISGGDSNFVGYGSYNNVIAGGKNNLTANAYGTVSGGIGNLLNGPGSLNVIGGGYYNTVGGDISISAGSITASSILGGDSNMIRQYASYSAIGGGSHNTIDSADSYSTISGGSINIIDIASPYSSISGGIGNYIGGNEIYATGPALHNDTLPGLANAVAGGDSNRALGEYGSVGGGFKNTIAKGVSYASIPGGIGLTAQSYSQFVAGRYNVPQGSNSLYFDGVSSIIPFINGDDFLAIFGNGLSNSAQSNAWTLSNSGYSTAYYPVQTFNILVPSTFTRFGSTYTNNTIIAEGHVDSGGNILDGIGFKVHKAFPTVGTYLITLYPEDGYGNQDSLIDGSITVTIEDPDTSGMSEIALTPGDTLSLKRGAMVDSDGNCDVANATPVGTLHGIFTNPNQFLIHIRRGALTGCAPDDHAFYFKVCGRPTH